jgi:hypothetical protein
MENALKSVTEKIGESAIAKLQTDWGNLKTNHGESEWELADGMLITLLRQGLSQIQIKSVLPVGGARIARIQKALTTILRVFGPRVRI